MVRKTGEDSHNKFGKGQAWGYLRVSADKEDVNNQRLAILKTAQDHALGPVNSSRRSSSTAKARPGDGSARSSKA